MGLTKAQKRALYLLKSNASQDGYYYWNDAAYTETVNNTLDSHGTGPRRVRIYPVTVRALEAAGYIRIEEEEHRYYNYMSQRAGGWLRHNYLSWTITFLNKDI